MGLRLSAWVGLTVLFWLGSAQGRAFAQRDGALELRAKRWFEQGVAASNAERWQQAELLFERSIELSPKSVAFLNLAVVRSRLGKSRAAFRALDAFDQVVAQEDLKRRAKWLRDELQAKLEQAEPAARALEPELMPIPWESGALSIVELAPLPW